LSAKKISLITFDIDQVYDAVQGGLDPKGIEEKAAIETVEPEKLRDTANEKRNVDGSGDTSPLSVQQLHSQRFIFGNQTESAPAAEAYKVLRTRLRNALKMKDYRSVVVTSPNRGEGKTLTALNLAACYAQLPDARVLLVDADLRTRRLTESLGESQSSGLAEALEQRAEYAEILRSTEVPRLHTVVAGRSTIPPPNLFTGGRFQEFIDWCRQSFTLVLIDSPPILALSDFELIGAACNGVLLVIRSRVTEAQAIRKAVAQINSAKLLGLVFNAVDDHQRSM
jgi:capsular exopolysaccharide synthesis family protein